MVAATMVAAGQYQLPNGGFEQWDASSATAEPAHWNSFATSDGSYASLASSPHHYHRQGGRPGTSGSSYLTIYTKSIVGIKANGNMTTGRIHAGSMSASSSDNYNYTERTNSAHSQPFGGTPDSMYVWVSYYAHSANSQAQITAYLHGDNDFKAPNDEGNHSLYRATATARFNRTTSSATSMQWQLLKIPFVYDGNSSVNYMLINLTTNATPGGGDANDSLSVDDIEFIYSAWLTGITVNGVPVPGFEKGVLDYTMHIDNLENIEVDFQSEVDDVNTTEVRETVDDTTVLFTIGIMAEDGVTFRRYRLTLTTGTPQVGITQPLAHSALPLRVYPNPATDAVTVEADGMVEICDLQGRVLCRYQVCGMERISLSTLPAGVYVVRCDEAPTKVTKQ